MAEGSLATETCMEAGLAWVRRAVLHRTGKSELPTRELYRESIIASKPVYQVLTGWIFVHGN